MKCPKCGSSWIVDYRITVVEKHKHWWSPVIVSVPYHEVHPEIKPYKCSECKHVWGEW